MLNRGEALPHETQMQRVGKREASANADFKVMTPSEDRQAPRKRRLQAYFDRALEASRLARTEGPSSRSCSKIRTIGLLLVDLSPQQTR